MIYDPFMGSGTTAVACKKNNFDCYGSELSAKQCEFAKKRLDTMSISSTNFKYKQATKKLF